MRTHFVKQGQAAFSLVELMVVVAIIGILAALAVPKFQTFQAKAKQSEAKNNLSHVYTLQESFYGDNDSYGAFGVNQTGPNAMNPIGFTVQGMAKYQYSSTGGAAFTATAMALSQSIIRADCMVIDTWTISEMKDLMVTNGMNCAQ